MKADLMDMKQDHVLFTYFKWNRRSSIIPWALLIIVCAALIIGIVLFDSRGVHLYPHYWCFIAPVVIIIVAILRRSLWAKKEQGECIKRGDSVFLSFGANNRDINLDDIKEIRLYDNRKTEGERKFDFWIGSPVQFLDPKYGAVCLEVKTAENSYVLIDRTESSKVSPINTNGLYKTMNLIRNTYKMRPKLDSNNIPMIDVYVSKTEINSCSNWNTSD